MATPGRPPVPTMLGRALLRRCPRCGGKGAWFRGWFAKDDRCHTCGYRYERQEGFVLGALTMNAMASFGAVLLTLVVGVVLTAPDVAVAPIVTVAVVLGVLLPILVYPVAYTLWAAVDLAMRPLDPSEEADALTWAAAQPGRDIAR